MFEAERGKGNNILTGSLLLNLVLVLFILYLILSNSESASVDDTKHLIMTEKQTESSLVDKDLDGKPSIKSSIDEWLINNPPNEPPPIIENDQENVSKDEEKPIDDDNVDSALKEIIDTWIEENNLNQFGDPQGTMYLGGTPLFSPETAETKNRYEYILESNPELRKVTNGN